ncbi:hypothetical protein C6A85_000000100370 [Mycobacterium sp. ITM-2017-0098]|nr:hypothetical protein C6A85_000000100370 [Mycobacterium sp. ITM-2017-0098]
MSLRSMKAAKLSVRLSKLGYFTRLAASPDGQPAVPLDVEAELLQIALSINITTARAQRTATDS